MDIWIRALLAGRCFWGVGFDSVEGVLREGKGKCGSCGLYNIGVPISLSRRLQYLFTPASVDIIEHVHTAQGKKVFT